MQEHSYINYLIFAIMYATSIFFSYKEYTESISILALFVINTSFLMYMSKDIFYHMTSKGISTSMLQYTIIFSILGSLLINSCALFLENLSLMTVRSKNSENLGNSLDMTTKNMLLFDDFRKSQQIFAILLGLILGSFLYYYENISFNLVNIVNYGGNWNNVISVGILCGGLYLLSLSSATLGNSREFSKVRL